MKVLVDIASIAKRALLAGQDKENGYAVTNAETGKEVWVNSAQYGYDNLSNSVATFCRDLGVAPCEMILVKDGVNGTASRKALYSGYKAHRSNVTEFYTEYNQMMQWFYADMLKLGCQTAQFNGDNGRGAVEADDLIAWFCDNLKEDSILIWTNDNDLLINAKHSHVQVYSNNQLNPKPYGEFPYEFIDVYKATVGDTSDGIMGAKGFGPKAFEAVYKAFGDYGMNALRQAIREKKLACLRADGDCDQVPQLNKLVDYANDVEISLELATAKTQAIRLPQITWEHGMCKGDVHPFLAQWQQKVQGITSQNFSQAFDDIKRLAQDNSLVSLDIETSTPETSDEWLYNIKGKDAVKSVDVFGSELTGLSITLGKNFQRTYYFAVNHRDTDNCSLEQIESVLKFLDKDHRFVIQNTNFELVVLHNTFGWFLRDVDDTKMMASYVDENESLGLKQNSLRWLGYQQESYESTVSDPETGRLRKMDELTLSEVLSYGADDTITTAALYNWYQLHMMLENVWQVYRDVEIGAAYWVAQSFIDGVKIDQTALAEMITRDAAAKQEEEKALNDYLITQGWEGSVFEAATEESWNTPAWIKYAFNIMTGNELKTQVRKLEKLIQEIRDAGCETLADSLALGDLGRLNTLVRSHFNGSPTFNAGSPKQMQKLMYEVMGLPIRIRNKPTDLMRIKGLEGTPSTDDVAIGSALHYDIKDENDVRGTVLKALLNIKMYNTREGLYYKTYPNLPHWKDRKIRSSLNQCSTVTRRYSSSQPK